MSNLLAYAVDHSLYLVVVLSAIPVGVATFVGLIVALLQAITQLQDQTLPFGIKLLAVCLALYMLSGWIGQRLLTFGNEMVMAAFR